jgi:hypothetical protein
MMRQRSIRPHRPVVAVILVCLLWLTGCSAHLARPALTAQLAPIPSLPSLAPTVEPTEVAPTAQELLALPDAFRYEVTVRPAGQPDEPATVITGQYRAGAWSQSSQRGEDAAEDLIVARDGRDGPLRSFTRPAGDATWTRWPGEDFDAGYGLASPLSVLRLCPLADQRAPGEAAPLQGVADPVVKTQMLFSADTVQRRLRAGAFVVAADPEERSAIEAVPKLIAE